MTWAEFKTNVRDHLHVHAQRAGIQTLIDRKIVTGVVDIQRYIDLFRAGQETIYEVDDFTAEGDASVAALPENCMPRQAEYVAVASDEECNRHPLRDYPFGNVRDLICGIAPITNCRYWISFDNYGTAFYVFPAVEAGYRVVLHWDGLKTSFADGDTVPFTEGVAEAVAEWVLITLAGEVDKNVSQKTEHKENYARLRQALYRDAQDRKRQRDDQPSPFPDGCSGTSGGTCMACSTIASVLRDCCTKTGPHEPEGIETGTPPDFYILDDGTRYELWIKRTGVKTKTGWKFAMQME